MDEGFKVAFLGDTSFGENYQAEIERDGGENILKAEGYAHSLGAVAPLLRASNLVIANLETALTRATSSAFAGSKRYVHWSDVQATPETLRAFGVQAVSLANNHALDFGPVALDESIDALNRNGIAWFGAGRTSGEAQEPYLRMLQLAGGSVQLAVLGAFQYRSQYKRLYKYYAKRDAPGVNRLSVERVASQIVDLKARMPDLYIVFFPHWGENYGWRTAAQAEMAHELVDAGADLVLGHGAHMMGEAELYRGKWIVFSLGNFVFNAPGRYEELRVPPYSYVAHLLFASAPAAAMTTSLRLYPILSDNRRTHYQPRFVTSEEFGEVVLTLNEKSPAMPAGATSVSADGFGPYIELNELPAS